jgi:hypothetical protein
MSRARSLLRLLLLPAVLLLALAGCGGDGGGDPMGPGGNNGGNGNNNGGNGAGPMSATIDGQAWTASAGMVTAQTNPSVPGLFVVQGTQVNGTSTKTITLNLYNIDGPGTYPMGVNIMVAGGIGIVATASAGWSTPLTGASGTVTITALDATRIAGTFAFLAGATYGSATTSTTVTGGTFDAVLPGNPLPPLPANAASQLSATIAGSPWNGATIVANAVSGTLVIGAGNTQYFVSVAVTGGAAPGTYALAPLTYILVSDPTGGLTGANCCWGGSAGGTGTITIGAIDGDRVSGSFAATLNPVPGSAATQPASVSGTFDIGLP